MTVAALQAINTAVLARVLATLGARTWTIDVDGVLCEYWGPLEKCRKFSLTARNQPAHLEPSRPAARRFRHALAASPARLPAPAGLGLGEPAATGGHRLPTRGEPDPARHARSQTAAPYRRPAPPVPTRNVVSGALIEVALGVE